MEDSVKENCLKYIVGAGVRNLSVSYSEKEKRIHKEFCSLPVEDIIIYWSELDPTTKITIIDNNLSLIYELAELKKNKGTFND